MWRNRFIGVCTVTTLVLYDHFRTGQVYNQVPNLTGPGQVYNQAPNLTGPGRAPNLTGPDMGSKTMRTLLIAHIVQTRDYVDAWLHPLCQQPRCCVHMGIAKDTDPKTHDVAESLTFFRFLQINYDGIKEGLFGMHIALLSDKGRDWHSHYDWSTLIKTATPRCRTPLTMKLADHSTAKYAITKAIKDGSSWNGNGDPASLIRKNEIVPITRILNVFNLTYTPEASDGWCCTESVISRKAILLYTKDQYKMVEEMILRDPDWKWGYALERIISVMFNEC